MAHPQSNYTSNMAGEEPQTEDLEISGTEDEIDVEERQDGTVRHFIISLASAIRRAFSNIQQVLDDLTLNVQNAKQRQTPLDFFGDSTKTPIQISQNANGELSVTYGAIKKLVVFVDNTYEANSLISLIGDGRLPVFYRGEEIYLLQSYDSANLIVEFCCFTNGQRKYATVTNTTWDYSNTATLEIVANKVTSNNPAPGVLASTSDYPSMYTLVAVVQRMLQNFGGEYISNGGAPFPNVASLPSSTPWSGYDIDTNDYAIVQDSSTTSRYTATVAGSTVTWAKEYDIIMPSFDTDQMAAINSGITATDVSDFTSHLSDTNNPHSVTKGQVGLGNVVNTGDSDTPASGGNKKFTTGGAYTELAKKTDKVAGATNGNFAGLDSAGNLTDSGSKASDFATSAQGVKADSAVQPGDNIASNKSTVSTENNYTNPGSTATVLSTLFGKIWYFFGNLRPSTATGGGVRDTSSASDTQFPSEKAVATALAGKQDSLGISGSGDTGKFLNERGAFATPNYPSVPSVIDNLESTSSTSALSANQGNILLKKWIADPTLNDYSKLVPIEVDYYFQNQADEWFEFATASCLKTQIGLYSSVSISGRLSDMNGNWHSQKPDFINFSLIFNVTHSTKRIIVSGLNASNKCPFAIASSEDANYRYIGFFMRRSSGYDFCKIRAFASKFDGTNVYARTTLRPATGAIPEPTYEFSNIWCAEGGNGSPTIPVYVDSNGQVQPCDPSQMGVGAASYAEKAKEGCKGPNTATLYIAGYTDNNIPYYHVKDIKNGCVNHVDFSGITNSTCDITFEAPTLSTGEEYDYIISLEGYTNNNGYSTGPSVENCKQVLYYDSVNNLWRGEPLFLQATDWRQVCVVRGNTCEWKRIALS